MRAVHLIFGLGAVIAAAHGSSFAQDAPVFGASLTLSVHPTNPTKRKFAWKSADPLITLSGIDPTVDGATVEIVNPGSQQQVTFPMPAAGWKAAGKPATTSFKYRDKAVFGPVTAATIKEGKLVKVTAKGSVMTFALGVAQGSLGASFRSGPRRFCTLFGGEIKKDDGLKFAAKKAAAPASCPSVSPTTTTEPTTTTTATTTTETSTTSTTAPTTSTTTTSTTTTTTGTPVCGNGVREGAEECDDGDDDNTNACTTACLNARCGDLIVWSGVEQCDDGNPVPNDGCTNCVADPAVCGNGIVQAGETCDDGNTANGDSCPPSCRIEPCAPSTSQQLTTIRITRNAPAPSTLAGVTVLLEYPDGQASLPGTGNASSVRARVSNTPAGRQVAVNDLDYALRVQVTGTTNITPTAGSPVTLFRSNFDLCTPPTSVTAGQFACTVEVAATTTGAEYTAAQLAGLACTVTVP